MKCMAYPASPYHCAEKRLGYALIETGPCAAIPAS